MALPCASTAAWSRRSPKQKSEDQFDKILVAVGREPNGALIKADAAGVKVDERGFMAVDKQMRTNVPHILAIGDVVGQPMLAAPCRSAATKA